MFLKFLKCKKFTRSYSMVDFPTSNMVNFSVIWGAESSTGKYTIPIDGLGNDDPPKSTTFSPVDRTGVPSNNPILW